MTLAWRYIAVAEHWERVTAMSHVRAMADLVAWVAGDIGLDTRAPVLSR
jgi:hypothetical protein